MGVDLSGQSVNVRLVNDKRSRRTVRSRSTSRIRPSANHGNDLQAVMIEFQKFFARHGNQFRHIHEWVPKPVPPASLVAKIDSLVYYMADQVRRDTSCDLSDLLIRYYSEKLGLRTLTEFGILDLLASSIRNRNNVMEIDTFVRLLTGFYDETDLAFLDFFKRAVHQTVDFALTNATFSFPDCTRIVRSVFGSQQAQVAEAVIETLATEIESAQCPDSNTVNVHVSYLVYIALWVFHHQRNRIDVRSSQHGFEEIVRQSFRDQVGEKNLIDSYVDSIIDLRNKTRILRETAQSSGNVGLEHAVNQILGSSCRAYGSSLDEADRLMQAVMSENKQAWTHIDLKAWNRALVERDRLLHAVTVSGDVETELKKFCDTIASIVGKVGSYY